MRGYIFYWPMFVKRKNQDAKIILLFLLINVKVYCMYFWFND